MATSFTELGTSRPANRSNGVWNAKRRFRVNLDTTGVDGLDAIATTFGSTSGTITMPTYNSVLPGSGAGIIPFLYAVEPSIDRVDGMNFTWNVEWSYITNPIVVGAGPGDLGYIEFGLSQKIEFVPMWRLKPAQATIPQFGNAASLTAQLATTGQGDIGGTRIDSGGAPVSVKVFVQQFHVREILSFANFDDYGARATFLATFIGNRNSSDFLGAGPGKVVYVGSEQERIGINKFTYTHTFAYDQYFHMRQTATNDQDNKVAMVKTGTIYQAQPVLWVQPFPDTSDLNNISQNF